MKRILLFLKKNSDLVFIYILLFFLSSPYLIDICSGYLNYHIYDLQSFLLWDYSLIKHLLPYKDLSYGYGLLEYYKKSNLLLLFIYYSIVPLNFTLIFYFFKKIIKYKYLLYISFILFYIFILNITGFVIFARYGIFIILSLLFSQFLLSKKNNSNSFFIYIGIIIGLFFSLINDLGTYLFSSIVVIILFNDLITIKNKINIFRSSVYYKSTIKKIFLLIIGFFIGIIPLVIFLSLNNTIAQFLHSLKDLRDIVIVAKTPFLNYFFTKDNLFIIFTLYFSISYLFIKIIFFKKINRFSVLIQTSLLIDILILQQKSIVRSISTQITFVALILIILVIYEFTQLKIISNSKAKMRNAAYLIVILIFLMVFQLTSNKNNYKVDQINNSLNMLINNKCYENNLIIFLSKDKSYLKVYNYFNTKLNVSNKIFVFPPGDSVYYILFKQIPPYISTIWNSSLANSQNTVEYLIDNKIEYVLLNTNTSLIADGVPDYIRIPLAYKYILISYYPIYKIENYIILKKYDNLDFFDTKILESFPEYSDYLMNVQLYKIPFSEGIYKGNQLSVDPIIRINMSEEKHFIDNLNLSSKNKIIVLIPSNNSDKNYMNSINIQSSTDDNTKINFNACEKNKMCIVNLSNLPYFYKERVIEKISLDDKFKGELLIFENNIPNILW